MRLALLALLALAGCDAWSRPPAEYCPAPWLADACPDSLRVSP